MSYQFVHMENFSRKGDRQGRSTGFVFSEARRDPAASIHVLESLPPVVIYGIDLDGLEQLHDEVAAAARTTPKGGKERAVRKDQNTLCTVVASHPFAPEEVHADPAKRALVLEWERRNITWLKNQFGDCLTSVVRHEDESRWHLHAYALPSGRDMKASTFHPGQQAKAAVMAEGRREGEDEKALNRRGDSAYRAAMRAWQDSYSQAVALPCGMARLGPGKRRLSRDQWHAEQQQAKALQAAIQRADHVELRGAAYIAKVQAAASVAKEKVAVAKTSIKRARLVQEKADKSLSEALIMTRAIETARRSADRTKGFGGLLRAFFDGLHFSKVREAVRAEFSTRLDQAQTLLDSARREALAERTRRREAETKATASSASIRDLARQRDEAWREVNSLQAILIRDNPEPTLNRKYEPR